MTDFANRKLARDEFEKFYYEKMYSKLCDLEQVRLEYRRHFFYLVAINILIIPFLISLMMGLGILTQNGMIDVETRDWLSALILVWFVIVIFVLSSPFNKYRQEMKDVAMTDFASFFGNFRYDYQNVLADITLRKSRLFHAYNQHFGDDYFSGKYKDVGIVISEEKLRMITGSGKQRQTSKIFSGIMIMLDMNKKFSGQTVLLRDWGIFNKLHMLFDNLENVKLEDVRFEREFEIFSDNQIEARYVLTTGFMEKIMQIQHAFSGKKIQLSFFDNKLLIAISTSKNMFETGSIFSSILNKARMERVFEQFYSVLSVVDILKLNQRICL